jgi:hypothetical protein
VTSSALVPNTGDWWGTGGAVSFRQFSLLWGRSEWPALVLYVRLPTWHCVQKEMDECTYGAMKRFPQCTDRPFTAEPLRLGINSSVAPLPWCDRRPSLGPGGTI